MATPSLNADQGDDMWQCRCFVLIMLRKLKITTNFARNKSGGGGQDSPFNHMLSFGLHDFFLSYYHHRSTSTLICLSQSIHQSAEEMAKSSLSIQVSFSPKSRSRVRVGHWIDF